MLLVEEKRVPVRISLVNMRAYGDKPAEFLRKVPGGLLPALEIADTGQVITESQVIMELLDEWHSEEDGYRPMSPPADDAPALARYERLARLEREYVSLSVDEFARG
jgi:glutathione S-transferase